MDIVKNQIIGLSDDGGQSPDLTSMYGEELLKHLKNNIQIEHNLQYKYVTHLYKIGSPDELNFRRFFNNLTGQIVITNYRLLFLTNPDLKLKQ